MVWVRFFTDFSFKPKPQVTIDYSAGSFTNVPTTCAAAALAAGVALAEDPPERASSAQVKLRPKQPEI